MTSDAQSVARGGAAHRWDRSIGRWSPLRRLVSGAVLIAAVFTLFQAVDYRQDVPSNDTYQYARQTLLYLGKSHEEAVHGATQMFCQDVSQSTLRNATIDQGGPAVSSKLPPYEACMQLYRDGLTPTNSRYIAIFTARPGYPLLSAGFASVFGLRAGLWIAAMLCTLVASGLIIILLRSAGAGVLTALGGQAIYLAAPTGYWGSRMLTDGPSLAATLLALLGAWRLARQRIRSGALLLLAGFFAGFVVRYSSQSMVAAALMVGAALCLWRVPSSRTRGMKWLLGLSAGGAVLSQVATAALDWPGVNDSLQDTFSKHFIRPDVPDPVLRLLSLNLRFWAYYPVLEPTALLVVLVLIVVGVALWRRDAVFAALTIVVAATGFGTVIVHPVSSQADRLMVAVWLLIALGVPLLLSDLRRRLVPAPATDVTKERQFT